jgi:hypothetical protein
MPMQQSQFAAPISPPPSMVPPMPAPVAGFAIPGPGPVPTGIATLPQVTPLIPSPQASRPSMVPQPPIPGASSSPESFSRRATGAYNDPPMVAPRAPAATASMAAPMMPPQPVAPMPAVAAPPVQQAPPPKASRNKVFALLII